MAPKKKPQFQMQIKISQNAGVLILFASFLYTFSKLRTDRNDAKNVMNYYYYYVNKKRTCFFEIASEKKMHYKTIEKKRCDVDVQT